MHTCIHTINKNHNSKKCTHTVQVHSICGLMSNDHILIFPNVFMSNLHSPSLM